MKKFELKSMTEREKRLLFGEMMKTSSIDNLNDAGYKMPIEELDNNNTMDQQVEPNSSLIYLKQKSQTSTCFLQKFVIKHNNSYASIWDIYILLLVCYSCITSAYYVAFDLPTDQGIIIFEIIVEVCFGIDILIRFIHEYVDPESYDYVSDIEKIAIHYLKGWFIIDFVAVFPFRLFISSEAAIWIKLLRLLKLPKFMSLLDQSKFDHIFENILQNHTREKRMNYLYASKYIYKVIRLILIATTLTYFVGCLWYYIASNPDINPGPTTFNTEYNLDSYPDHRKLIMCCYFALTTLATVGYGDLTPQTNLEKIVGVLIMILGIALFSYIMGNFNDVLTNYDKQMGIVDKSADLQVWMTSLSKFTANQPLPRQLVQKIDEHFKFFWKNDRLSSLTPDDKYLQKMPEELKYNLVKFLFEDIFVLFRGFLLSTEFRDSPFYYEIAFELLPRKYDSEEIILQQGEIVHEVYMIKEGSVHIYFEFNGEKIGKYFGKGYYFGNFNIFKNIPAEFNYKAIKTADNVQATKIFAIPKQKLLKLLKKYPEICSRMIENSKRNSNSIRDILKHELKLKLQLRNPNITNQEVDDIFKSEVLEKSKLINQFNSPEKNGPLANENNANPIVDFNKTVGDELDIIINKLHKLRDQIATKEPNKE